MKIRITDPAKADLSNIRLYLQDQNPAVARKVGRQLRHACFSLADFPNRGRQGLEPSTRENVAVWPYVIVYRVTGAEVQILRVWHHAQERSSPG